MGQGYGFRCSNCGYEDNLLEGQGFMLHGMAVADYLNDRFLKFHASTHRKIVQLAQKFNGMQIHTEYKGFVCSHCNIPYTKLYVEVYKGGRIYHQTSFRCNRCKKELREKKIKLSQVYRCPKCYAERFAFENAYIQWD